MAHFAKVENNIVKDVIVVNNDTLNNLEFPESEPVGQEFIASLGIEGEWKQTSYNGNFRGNYAGIEFTYDEVNDVFISPKPFESWVLNEETYQWEPPTPMPTVEGDPAKNHYVWDELNTSWKLITEE